jgi:hypothetical protein
MTNTTKMTVANVAQVIYLGSLACLFFAMLGSVCFAHRRCTPCAVQTTGCSWVFHTLLQIELAVVAALFFLATLLVNDAGTVLLRAPREPTYVLGTAFCEQANISINDGHLDLCGLLSDCWSSPPKSPTLAELGSRFGIGAELLTPAGIDSKLDPFLKDSMPVNLSTISGWSSDTDAAVASLALVNASTFGIPAGRDEASQIEDHLTSIASQLEVAITHLDSVADSTDGFQANVDMVLAAVDPVKAALEPEVVDVMFECSWVQPAYDRIIEPHLHGDLRDGLFGLGATLLTACVAGFCIVGGSVACQVRFGDVGQEPGCPRRCRCCCRIHPESGNDMSRLLRATVSSEKATTKPTGMELHQYKFSRI